MAWSVNGDGAIILKTSIFHPVKNRLAPIRKPIRANASLSEKRTSGENIAFVRTLHSGILHVEREKHPDYSLTSTVHKTALETLMFVLLNYLHNTLKHCAAVQYNNYAENVVDVLLCFMISEDVGRSAEIDNWMVARKVCCWKKGLLCSISTDHQLENPERGGAFSIDLNNDNGLRYRVVARV